MQAYCAPVKGHDLAHRHLGATGRGHWMTSKECALGEACQGNETSEEGGIFKASP